MSGPVKIKVELSTGTIDVETDAGNINAIFDRLDSFLPRLSAAYATQGESDRKSNITDNTTPPVDLTESKVEVLKNDNRPRTPRGSSKTKESYKTVDLELTEANRAEMREIFNSKQPKSQNEKMAVLMDCLKKFGKNTVTWNEIFTSFRSVDSKSPAKISSVLGNMVGLGWVRNVGAGHYELTHVGEDFVKFNLPKAVKEQ